MDKLKPIEAVILNRIDKEGLPWPKLEHRFCERLWRFDFAWPDKKIALEFEGGVFTNGAHTRGAHYESDCEKYNTAALLGWKVLRYTTDMVDQITRDLKFLLEGEKDGATDYQPGCKRSRRKSRFNHFNFKPARRSWYG